MPEALFLDGTSRGTLVCRLDESTADVVRVNVRGEIDLATVPILEAALDDALAREGPVVLDLRDVSFGDSSGLHLVVCADRGAHQSGRRLVIVKGPPQVHRPFVLTGLDARLEIVEEPALVVATEPALTGVADGRQQ